MGRSLSSLSNARLHLTLLMQSTDDVKGSSVFPECRIANGFIEPRLLTSLCYIHGLDRYTT